jgi:RNA polymerase sigma factor (TIGR02999 family)
VARNDVSRLLEQVSSGDGDALAALMPVLYQELHKIARHHLRLERPDHTLQPTALINEAYLRLLGQSRVRWQNRAHFLGIASQLMRRILIDYARARRAEKRGGLAERITLDDAVVADRRMVDVMALDGALEALATIDPQQSRIVELRYFGGLTIDETAEVLQISAATVKRDWNVARAWLHREITMVRP